MHVAAALRVAFPCSSSLSFKGEEIEEEGRGVGGREEGRRRGRGEREKGGKERSKEEWEEI